MDDYISDVAISAPVLYPDVELVPMGGFSFSQDQGIVVSLVSPEVQNGGDPEWLVTPQ